VHNIKTRFGLAIAPMMEGLYASPEGRKPYLTLILTLILTLNLTLTGTLTLTLTLRDAI